MPLFSDFPETPNGFVGFMPVRFFCRNGLSGRINRHISIVCLAEQHPMKTISSLSSIYLSTFSSPACDRILYRTIRRQKVSSILEVGVGNATRAVKMIRMAQKYSGTSVRYTGVDTFEANPSCQITYKDCHQQLSLLGCRLQLVPGELVSSIRRIANSHVRTDLLIISSEFNDQELDNIWYYVPRMLHAASIVFLQSAGEDAGYFEQLGRLEIERMVQKSPPPVMTRAA